MDDNEIVDNFFMHGCTTPKGERLPLRNCQKIYNLYDDELHDCCCGRYKGVYIKYKQRLYEFLKRERSVEIDPEF
jgi:hypothetical protein|tara:strand:+ start:154 stop:378 length:225 start_codon:yes stop_codon:yes gene_type:complete